MNDNHIRVGQSASVPDPNPTDIHHHAFVGTVADMFPDKGTVIVEGRESDSFEIEAGRLVVTLDELNDR